jgi:glycerol kinase
MSYVGAIDQGTTSSRFMIFDHEGAIVGLAQKEHKQILPQPGWVEHDPHEIWENVQEVVLRALKEAGIRADELVAIGITNQRETTVAWDAITGQALCNAIVWQDTRTQSVFSRFGAVESTTITHKTGLPLAPYFSGSKITWMSENVPAVRDAVRDGRARFGTIDSWLLWNLTAGQTHRTDVTNASRTLLMNLETLDWDDELLALFGVARESLGTIASSSELYAHTPSDGFLGAAIPIAGILGDQQAAMVGQLCFTKGQSKTTYGTGNFALVNTGAEIVRSTQGLLTTVCFKFGQEPARYALEGSVAVTGSAVQWLRDQLGIISQSSEVETLAQSVADNGGVYFVPAFSGLFAPYWRSDARGVLVGLTRAATKAHIARATLEAIAYQTYDVIKAMEAEIGTSLVELRVDGGITQNELCMQIQSDVLGIPLVKPAIAETTVLGAAYAAGLAVGFWKSTDELLQQQKIAKRWEPKKDSALATSGLAQWKKAIARTLDWA